MNSLYEWIKFLHVIAAITFMVAHGSSIAISFRVKHEQDLGKVKTMLDLSGTMWVAMMLSLLVAGIAASNTDTGAGRQGSVVENPNHARHIIMRLNRNAIPIIANN